MLNQKGGVGKTTTTVNLGHALALAGKRVCLIDLDPQGHLTLHFGIEQDQVTATVYDLLIDPECLASSCLVRGARENIDVILAEVDLAAAETELVDEVNRQSILRRKFDEVASEYDIVLIDCPPSLGLLTLNALAMADELMVPMQAHFLALQGVGRLLNTVGLVSKGVNPHLKVSGVVLCMYESQTTLAREIVADLEDFFEAAKTQDVPWNDCCVMRPPVRRNIKLAEAPSFGNTIFDYAPWCPGALDYRKLAQNLLMRWEPESYPADADAEEAHDVASEMIEAATAGMESEPEPQPDPEPQAQPEVEAAQESESAASTPRPREPGTSIRARRITRRSAATLQPMPAPAPTAATSRWNIPVTYALTSAARETRGSRPSADRARARQRRRTFPRPSSGPASPRTPQSASITAPLAWQSARAPMFHRPEIEVLRRPASVVVDAG